MATMKLFLKIVDMFMGGILGLIILDLIKVNIEAYSNISTIIKMLAALAGLIYFILSIPHKIKTQRADRKLKRLQIEQLEIDNKNKKKDRK